MITAWTETQSTTQLQTADSITQAGCRNKSHILERSIRVLLSLALITARFAGIGNPGIFSFLPLAAIHPGISR
jgi:hypothetical protein